MNTQNLIRRTLFSDEGREKLAALPASEAAPGRLAFARKVCTIFDFCDCRGRPQVAGCLAALRELERRGVLVLPPAGAAAGARHRPQRLGQPVPPAVGVPDRVDRIEGLAVVRVEDPGHRRIFNELMEREHPQGAVLPFGRQLGYLIGSDHGWLGGCLFAASALVLQPRDRWIGWNADEREQRLHRVVGLTRFLVRPHGQCRNLASKVLSLCLQAMVGDFEARYGIVPLLAETFVGPGYDGASLRAANWVYVGETAGRGRRAAKGAKVPVKSVYVIPLARDWRAQLGVAGRGLTPASRPPVRPHASWTAVTSTLRPIRLVRVLASSRRTRDLRGHWDCICTRRWW